MKVLLIEDESAAARRLEKMIIDLEPGVEILAQLDSIEAAVSWLTLHPNPDLIFLDIHLADGACFEIFEHVQVECPIIFTTAYDEYALQAFKVNAIDYLLKPIKQPELEQALAKYQKLRGASATDYRSLLESMQKEGRQPMPRRILIRFGQSIKLVDFKEVAYFYTQDKITFLITKAGKRYPIDYTLDRVSELADEDIFYRINRQFVVNIEAIKEMYAYSKSRVKLELTPPCDMETIVSTERSSEFKKWLVGGEVF